MDTTQSYNLYLLEDKHARILKSDGKETQGTILNATDKFVWMGSNGIQRIIPWTSIITLTLLPTDNPKPDTAPESPRTTETTPTL